MSVGIYPPAAAWQARPQRLAVAHDPRPRSGEPASRV